MAATAIARRDTPNPAATPAATPAGTATATATVKAAAAGSGPASSSEVVGVALVAAGATAYGITKVLGRVLAGDGVHPATALGVRFGLAAVLLGVVAAARRSPLLPARGERLRIFLLGAIGYATESTLFYMALERGTVAAAALLFYAYPLMVAVTEGALGWGHLRPRALLALLFSAAGTILVVASSDDLGISSAGIVCALASAVAFGAYLLACTRLVRRSDQLAQAAWVAVGASVASVARGLATGDLASPAGHWAPLVAYGVVTAVAFACMLAGLARLGASRTALLMTLEAFVAVTLAAAVLGESLAVAQLVGGAGIVAAAVLVSRGERTAPDAERVSTGICGEPLTR